MNVSPAQLIQSSTNPTVFYGLFMVVVCVVKKISFLPRDLAFGFLGPVANTVHQLSLPSAVARQPNVLVEITRA
jgi:hypothetical protein